MRGWIRRAGMLTGMAALVAADQCTKALAAAHLRGVQAVEVIPGFLGLRYTENTGAAFGMLQGVGAAGLYFAEGVVNNVNILGRYVYAGNGGKLFICFCIFV